MSRKRVIVAIVRGPRRGVFLAACGLLALVGNAGIALGQASIKRFPITNREILDAMRQRQLPVGGVQIRLAAPITATVADPDLDIHSLAPGDKHSAQLLVGCRNSAQCLPFYVSASWPVDVDVASLHRNLLHATDDSHDIADRGSIADASALRAGSSATLLLDGKRVHVTLRVVCLESGETGENVRVITPDRRQQYVANVIAPGVLKGTF